MRQKKISRKKIISPRGLLEERLGGGSADGELLELGGQLGEVGVVMGVERRVDVVTHAASAVGNKS